MIRYSLACKAGHAFEAWFRNSGAYDAQARRRAVACPECGSTEVEKAPMAPNVAARRAGEGPAPAGKAERARARMLEMARQVREAVTRTADYVGDRFPEEARKIHYEEAEARGIYGEATREEARELIEEGVDVRPLPALPEDKN